MDWLTSSGWEFHLRQLWEEIHTLSVDNFHLSSWDLLTLINLSEAYKLQSNIQVGNSKDNLELISQLPSQNIDNLQS